MSQSDEKIKLLDEMRGEAERETVDNRRRGGDNGGNDGGEPPMSDLEARVKHLEQDTNDIKVTLARMEGRFDAMDAKFEALDHRFDATNTKLDTFATKADISDTKVSMIKWSVSTVIAAGLLVFAIMRALPAV